MDPTTFIVLLSVNLVCSGGLFVLISRRMPMGSGVAEWSAGMILFGSAFLGRQFTGLATDQPGAVVVDCAMMLGAWLYLAGLRQWLGLASWHRFWLPALTLAYAATHLLAASAWAVAGRFMLLNLSLAAVFGVIAAYAALAWRRQTGPQRPPLLPLALTMGLLSLLTAHRGVLIATLGTASLFKGLWAQIYYGLSSLAVVLLGLNLLWMVFMRLNAQLLELASRDALTRVLNRNGLDDVLARHFAARGAAPLTFLEVDVDHFKRINDDFGHATGDAVLRAVADALAKRVRGNDFVARVGGEEFLVGCVGGDMGVALSLGERLRAGVAALRVPGHDERALVKCTVSVGISRSFRALSDRDQAAREADRALYAAKADGRNRVLAFEQVKA